MAVKEVLVSDLTGEEIANGSGARVTIHLASKPASTFTLDANETDLGPLLEKANERVKRGRKPKAVAAA